MDDMCTDSSNRWEPFVRAIELARENHVVASPALITGRMHNASKWVELQEQMFDGYLAPTIHTATHPVDYPTNYYAEYIGSRQTVYDNLELPWQYTYEGMEHLVSFVQWGGAYDKGTRDMLLSTNGYLVVRSTSSYEYDWATWNATTNWYGSVGHGDNEYILTGSWASNHFNTVYSNGQIFHMYSHPWQDMSDPSGSNSNIWKNLLGYVGNRHDVWYVGWDNLYSYHYLQDRVSPDIVVSNVFGDIMVTVTGNHAERVKYGLSYPLTYEFAKPEEWADTDGVSVYYRDPVDADWILMQEKTENDYFTGINAYRDAGDVVYISQGLPQTTDTFDLLVRPYRIPQQLISDYIVNHAEELNLYPSNVVLDVGVGQMLLSTVNDEACMTLQLEQSYDLQTWMNAGVAVDWVLPMETNTLFIRVRAEP